MENQCSPYNIWKPKNDINDITEIGGISAGNGIGGEAKWTEDGKFVTGTTPWDNIVIQKDGIVRRLKNRQMLRSHIM